ncbi:carbohydrate ABC transporter permease [Halopenitus persicus]|uniref:carbohydrate ABC transporter permease n=1 Tax=Halopenitus persicus TaxID=1048396 RepID=UPI001E4B86EA|nr:sugar ABC transporter permease [Halopenitus persicus]
MSLHQWSFTSTAPPEFIGLENYIYLFGWEPFYTSLKATALFATTTLVQLIIALTAALLVNSISRFKNLISSSFLIPYTLPPVATGTIWLYLINPNVGPIFKFLTNKNILDSPIYWSVQSDTALMAVIGITSWTFWPFMFLILLASLESIPEEYYESARMYGAGIVDRFLHITLPHLKTAILLAVSIRMVWNLTKVSQIYQLTGGGPGYSTSILAVFLYRFAYDQGQFGLAFAVGVVLLIITLAFTLLFIRGFEKSRSDNE